MTLGTCSLKLVHAASKGMEDEQVSYDRRHGCIHCGSLTFSNEYFRAFNVGLQPIMRACDEQEHV